MTVITGGFTLNTLNMLSTLFGAGSRVWGFPSLDGNSVRSVQACIHERILSRYYLNGAVAMELRFAGASARFQRDG